MLCTRYAFPFQSNFLHLLQRTETIAYLTHRDYLDLKVAVRVEELGSLLPVAVLYFHLLG